MGAIRLAPDDAARRLDELLHLHERRVLAYATRRLPNGDDAEDVAAETFIIAWRKIEQVPAEALPWLLSVARRVLANHRRGSRRRALLRGRLERQLEHTQVDLAAEQPSDGPVLSVLRRLRPDDREILCLVAWDELGTGQVAEVLGITPNAAAIRLHRARKRFSDELMKDPDAIRTSTEAKGAINGALQERME
jgi:RNA polymerase sigma-70 factor, ECF subfamily